MDEVRAESSCEGKTGPDAFNSSVWRRRGFTALHVVQFAAALYCFLLSVTLIGTGFKLFGKPFSEALVTSTENPFIALLIGVLATSIVQSSSATTSMVVGMVAAGTLTVPNSVPIIMGANIGTTVTCALVSLGHITRKEEFRRAMSAAFVHDFFNLLAVVVLLPLELTTHFLERSAVFLSSHLWGTSGVEFESPLKAILKPVAGAIAGVLEEGLPRVAAAILILVLAAMVLFGSLWAMTRMMRKGLAGRAETLLDKTIGRSPLVGLAVGAILTAIIQSSSAVTSILVPLAGAGVLTVEQIFPITLGANIGTTMTAILAALAAGPVGLTIALVHLLFNVSGILIIYPFQPIRAVPIWLAKRLAGAATESKRYAIAYIIGMFFVVPGLLILVSRLF